MNLFVTSPNHYECAIALDDKRLNKMCVETAQILSTALWHRGIIDVNLYKPVMIHHPIVLWAKEKDENLWFTYLNFCSLFTEYFHRFNKKHATSKNCFLFYQLVYKSLEKEDLVKHLDFCNCARNTSLNLDFTNVSDVFQAYRMYLNARWKTDKREPKWTNRTPPAWKEN